MKEGWTWLINSKRDHYFRNGKSLCGKWACLGNDFTEYPDGIPCATCLKKREKEEEEIEELLEFVDSQFDGDANSMRSFAHRIDEKIKELKEQKND